MSENTSTTILVAKVNGQEYKWEVQINANELVKAAARKGYQEWLQDASSTAKPSDENAESASAEDRRAAVKARDAKIKAGTYTPGGGGGGGSRLTLLERATRFILEQWARENGQKAAAARKFAANTESAWSEITRQALLAEAAAQGMSGEQVRKLDLAKLITENTSVVQEAYKPAIQKKMDELRKASEKSKPLGIKGIKLG